MKIDYDTITWPNGADISRETLRYWCELGRAASDEETDVHFLAQHKAVRVAEEPWDLIIDYRQLQVPL